MNRIITALKIVTNSLTLIFQHPKLLVFPVINMAGLFFLVVFFALPVFFETSVFSIDDGWAQFTEMMQERGAARDEGVPMEPVTIGNVTFNDGGWDFPIAPLAVFYLLFMFLMTYVNVAYYAEILQAYSGNPVLLMRGLAFAAGKWRAILVWSLLAGFIGLLIRKIEDNVGFVGRWIMGLIGFTWSVASVFAIPVIIREQQQSNPVAYLKTSASIIKRTWGEGLTGVVSISLVTMGCLLLVVPLAVVVMVKFNFIAVYVMLAIFVLIFVLGYLSMLIRDVFLCGLYVYATEGVVPGDYDPALMEQAWKVKKRK